MRVMLSRSFIRRLYTSCQRFIAWRVIAAQRTNQAPGSTRTISTPRLHARPASLNSLLLVSVSLVALVCLAAAPLLPARSALRTPHSALTPLLELVPKDAMIPMRDGVHLYTQIYSPAQSTEK